jgi:hypothetical protein
MKRAFVFLVVAPVSVFVTVFLFCVTIFGGESADFAALCAMVLAVVTLPTSAITGVIDGFLGRAVPIPSRVFLTAIAGATIATGEAAVFISLLPQSIVMALAIGAAVVMGACSLLSHDYSGWQRFSIEPANA